MACKIIKTGTVSRYDDKQPYNAWPSVTTLSNGDIYCAYSGLRMWHICPFGKVVSARSTDGGYSWDEPKIVINTPLDDRDAGLTEVDGALYLTSFNNSRKQQRIYAKECRFNDETIAFNEKYMATITDEDEKRYLGSVIAKSTDGGKTFTDPVVIPITAPHGVVKLNDGSMILIGRSFHDSENASFEYLPEGIYAMKINPDLTYEKPYLIVPNATDKLLCEPHAVDLGDKILLGIRVQDNNGLFTIYHAYSYDGGKTFTEPKPTGYEGSPPHYLKHSSGAVILTYSRRKAPFPTLARISYDNGVTFGDEIVLCPSAPSGDLGYPCSTENANGEIVTVYYQQKENEKGNTIQYTIWSL